MTITVEKTRSDTESVASPAGPPASGRSFGARMLFGPADQPRWARPSLLALLAATAVLYLWGLGSSGWANDFYAAAVQAGTQDWKAWLFGSLDSGNAITVDKPPAALWLMVLSGRLFGFSAFTMLLPEALLGVGAVALLNATVRRCSGPAAGLIAGAVLALTPVATVMFRYNNPDALLVFLLVVAAYCTLRATETSSSRWIALAGAVMGLAFLTKMMAAFLVLPGFALVVLVAAPGSLWKRLGRLLVAGAAVVASAGWFIALVSLWPSAARPFIGGSSDNSLLQLALGYNGVDRVVGSDGGPAAGPGKGGPGGAMFGGGAGIGRLFGESVGTQVSWLLPAALIGLLAGLWFTRRTPRTGPVRTSLLLWGGWLLVTAAVFSFMGGIFHPYYTVALAPAIAALVAISARELWRGKDFLAVRITLAVMSAGTGVWSFVLLDRTPEWLPALRWVVLAGSILSAAVLLVGAHRARRSVVVLVAAAMLFGIAGPAAYAVDSVLQHQGGAMPTAGPSTGGFGPGGHGGFGHRPGGPGGPGGHGAHGGPGGPGGGTAAANTELQSLVKSDADKRWAAASVGSMTASSLELQTGTSIMAIGGFSGSDDSPTLGQFQQYVADGQVGYFIAADATGGPGGGHSGADAAQITAWIEQHFTPTVVGGTTVYNLAPHGA